MRIQEAGQFFFAYGTADNIVGFVNGTVTTSTELTEESMEKHEPQGSTLCIHSVCIDQKQRRKGYGGETLKRFVSIIRNERKQIRLILLICKKYLIDFYKDCGFELLGPSKVVHG